MRQKPIQLRDQLLSLNQLIASFLPSLQQRLGQRQQLRHLQIVLLSLRIDEPSDHLDRVLKGLRAAPNVLHQEIDLQHVFKLDAGHLDF